MIYTTGSIAVSGNTLTGTGTNFTAAGSLIRAGCTVLALTSPAQAFQITSVDSATSLTVTPAASPAVPAGTKFAILLSDSLSVDGLAQDIAETFSMYQRYMGGFADVMNGSGDVTITINGQPVTVPGQKSLAKKGANSDITSLTGLSTPLSIGQGGTGEKDAAGARKAFGLGGAAVLEVGSDPGTVAAGNDPRFGTVDGKTGGIIRGGTTSTPASGDPAGPRTYLGAGSIELYANTLPNVSFYWGVASSYTSRLIETAAGTLNAQAGSGVLRFRVEGGYACRAGLTGVSRNNYYNFDFSGGQTQLYIDTSLIGNLSTTAVSDRALKKDISYLDEADAEKALREVMQWKPATYKFRARGELIPESDTRLGIIANDLVEVSPECVSGTGLDESYDGVNPYTAFSLNPDAISMKLTMAVQVQQKQIAELQEIIRQLQSGS